MRLAKTLSKYCYSYFIDKYILPISRSKKLCSILSSWDKNILGCIKSQRSALFRGKNTKDILYPVIVKNIPF